ncbi:type III restriction-modification system StyLTI enzyme Mod [Thermoanaerobacter kivui]|uniref:Type III restriction-modification system StyLTI enzyme Mod n=1 Tax=Thermoanaerobacter kivui TaxID=2325 RepID=A0A097AS42_THEKI|nr:site-specific DNA-methyltransferase [Thermoanaerobacter kivui]AIS52622.1 type III restriction-modification system StyLTI enzyme Mod [Thermoanaerobacter kivui]
MENKVSKEIFNPVQDNIKKLAELFPTVVKDGQVDFEALKQELGQVEEVGKEKYELTWPGKTLAKQLALTDVVGKTLKYVPEESKNPDTTENLYIEGDNLEVLKLLRNSYYGKIKMIYIDPPYNTGNDFIYKDDFKKLKEESDKEEGELDENGERLIKNQRSSARFHSNWLNMMYPRLKVAKDLLSDDGVIFISIDDNEVDNLKLLANEIFGEKNFIACFPWRKRTAKSDVPFGISQDYEWILCYAKSELFVAGIERKRKYYETPDFNGRPWRIHDLTQQKSASERPNSYFTIINPKTGEEYPADPNNVWRVTKDTFKKYYKENKIVFPGDYDFLRISKPVLRYFKDEDEEKAGEKFGYKAVSTLLPDGVGLTEDGTKEIKELFGVKLFNFPKPSSLIKYLIKIATAFDYDSIILDFFSGSATTAHAVMQLNAEDGGKRKFIMVQLPEKVDEESEAYKAGFKTIADIGKERIRRAGEKIKEEFKDKEWIDDLDIGFKVFKVAETNIRWNDEVFDGEQITLSESALSVKDALDFNPGFTDIDVVYEIMLRHRDFPLTSKIEKLTNIGNRTYMFADSVVVCLEETITSDIVDKIASLEPKPIKIIFRDSAFDDDISLKLNILHRLDTQIKLFNQGKDQTYRVEFI